MMKTLRLRNWAKWQSYRRDRGQPPWIKVHRALLRDVNWVALSDSQRGQLVSLWMLAADKDGEIPASPEILQKLCFMESEPDLELFTNHGFIESDANTTPTRRQGDEPEKRRVEENRVEENRGGQKKDANAPDFESIYNLNREAWEKWLAYRRSTNKTKYKTTGRAKALAKLPHEMQMLCVENSIDQMYVGIFPENFDGKASKKRTYAQQLKDDMDNAGL